MNDFLAGAIAVSSAVAGLFFLRFWKSSNDRFFLFFALSFLIEAANRILITLAASQAAVPERIPILYLIRLAAFCLILYAIYGKNRPRQ